MASIDPLHVPSSRDLRISWLLSSVLAGCAMLFVACAQDVDGGAFDDQGDAASTGDDASSDPSPSGTGTPHSDAAPPPPGATDSGSKPTPSDAAPPPPPEDAAPPPPAGDLQHCVDVINKYRASIGAKPYARSSELEAFATEGAKEDSKSGEPHGHFMATSGGGVAWAENEIPGWPKGDYGGVTGVVDEGCKAMWDEGPGGGHHDNMASHEYTQVGCGIFVTASGDVWITQDFR